MAGYLETCDAGEWLSARPERVVSPMVCGFVWRRFDRVVSQWWKWVEERKGPRPAIMFVGEGFFDVKPRQSLAKWKEGGRWVPKLAAGDPDRISATQHIVNPALKSREYS